MPVDRFEAQDLSFHNRVRRGYLDLAAEEPGRWLVLDGTRPVTEVSELAWREVARRLESEPT